MESEFFRKYPFRASTLIEYTSPRSKKTITCSLSEVDFDEEILTICPLDSTYYERDLIQVNIKHCEIFDKKIIKLKL
jgi:hypothetical protein